MKPWHRVSSRPGTDAGVGQDDIEVAECGDPFLHDVAQLLPEAHVTLAGDDPAVQRLDLFDRLRQVLGGGVRVVHAGDGRADVHGDDVCTLLGQSHRMAPTLTTRGTGDECDFPLELAHLSSSDSCGFDVGPRNL